MPASTGQNEDVGEALDRLCPHGIDVYFDNVGGEVMLAAYDRMADFGRIVVCGMASEYNAPEAAVRCVAAPGAAQAPADRGLRRLRPLRGAVRCRSRRKCSALIDAGRMKYRIEVIDGFAEAPAALARLLDGRNKGKMIVQLSPDPTV